MPKQSGDEADRQLMIRPMTAKIAHSEPMIETPRPAMNNGGGLPPLDIGACDPLFSMTSEGCLTSV